MELTKKGFQEPFRNNRNDIYSLKLMFEIHLCKSHLKRNLIISESKCIEQEILFNVYQTQLVKSAVPIGLTWKTGMQVICSGARQGSAFFINSSGYSGTLLPKPFWRMCKLCLLSCSHSNTGISSQYSRAGRSSGQISNYLAGRGIAFLPLPC